MKCAWIVLTMVAVGTMRPGRVNAQLMDEHLYTFVQFDQLEYRRVGTERPFVWDMMGWIGGDFNRFWIKSEGERATVGNNTAVEVQALYSRLIAPFWEVQLGMRLDAVFGGGFTNTRVLAAFGFEGLAPYWFEMEPVLFVSQDGDISARLTSSYDVFVTQRLIAQARFEANGAVQDVPEFGVGSGLNDVELGLRMRYEVQRKTAPYLGINWERRFGETAAMVRAAGDGVGELSVVAGIRLWF